MKWMHTLFIIFFTLVCFIGSNAAADSSPRKAERKRAQQQQVKQVKSPFENEIGGNWGIALLVGAGVYLAAQHINKK
ncbi:hypothetical protein [Thalassomonas sp. RHCl1]|uniref:hypothetical protein n=1 Tax=Thalassomonas sp. RHCl1 TaxID=2995320 RepID=UPI00248C1EFA|nr:hypothetical protein [Thalassomonas sp. RHCl1]